MSQYEIDSDFQSPLGQEELFLLLETGIKFFLYQRGQIPLPYERLRMPDDQNSSQEIQQLSTLLHHKISDDSESLSNVERIQKLKSQRKVMRQDMRIAQRDKRLYKMEINTRMVLDDVFLNLRSIFLSPYISNVTAVIVVFGSSIYHQKEMITFRIDPALKTDNVDEVSDKSKTARDFSSNVRNFCKSIIMSSEFLDFTEKSLRTTFTHLCLLTNQELEDSELKKNLLLVEDYHHIFGDSSQTNQSYSRSRQKNSLLINLKLRNSTTMDESTMEDSSSFCYQLPFRFKGIHVKNSIPS